MPIYLNTGVPGAGKTLSMVEELASTIKGWEKKPDDARPVFVHGINGLALPHAVMPLKSVQADKAGTMTQVPDWDEMPNGSLVIIDECQTVFPPRSSQSTPPPHVAWLNTHRHKGFDIWITTQQPRLIDSSVRALVGRHRHFRRMFGMQRSVIYEWDACSDNLSGTKNAVATYWSFPRKAFQWYKSAEIHTKQKFKLPLWLGIFPLGIVMAAFFWPRMYTVLSGGMSGKGLNSGKTSAAEVGQVAAIAATPPALQLTGYYLQGTKCFGVRRNGELVDEPADCREKVK